MAGVAKALPSGPLDRYSHPSGRPGVLYNLIIGQVSSVTHTSISHPHKQSYACVSVKKAGGSLAARTGWGKEGHMFRVGQNRVYAPYMTVYLVISLPKYCIHRIYMVLANPTHSQLQGHDVGVWGKKQM